MKPITIIIFALFLSSFSNAFSQDSAGKSVPGSGDTTGNHKQVYMRMTIRNAPSLTLQLSGSYDYGIYELSANDNGDFSPAQFKDGQNFGVRHGIGGNLTVKIPLHEKGNLRLNISVLYNTFSSQFSKVFVTPNGPDYAKYNVFSGGIGIENNFTPNFRFKTYVGAGLIASIISGKARITNPDFTMTDLSVVPAFRMGITLYSGLEYMIYNQFGLNFGFKFTHANLWLKQSTVSNNPNEIYLNDKRTLTDQPYSGFRQFVWGSFFCGVNYYFGVNEKQYVYRK